MNNVARTTLGGRIRAARNALRGKPAGQITFGLRVIRCDECDRINRKDTADPRSEVGERGELYSSTMRRLARMGAKTHVEQIICLAKEIERYRARLLALEGRLSEKKAPKPRYTIYDRDMERYVVPLLCRMDGSAMSIGVKTGKVYTDGGSGGQCYTGKDPDLLYGEVIDRLAELENMMEG